MFSLFVGRISLSDPQISKPYWRGTGFLGGAIFMKWNFVALDVVKSVNPYQQTVKLSQIHYKERTETFEMRDLYNGSDPNCKLENVFFPRSIK